MNRITKKVKNKIAEHFFSLESGFFYIIFVTGEVFQCCLSEGKKGFVMQIKVIDCGFDDGICGDANVLAIKKYSVETCLTALFYCARKSGIKLITQTSALWSA